mmetsp:Transcript_13156/g.27841  ORF Transcript_13156/g.27841 Transcript_13156/m.27841 type:complete len:216 (+) Transcript_13156:483-1130(+)
MLLSECVRYFACCVFVPAQKPCCCIGHGTRLLAACLFLVVLYCTVLCYALFIERRYRRIPTWTVSVCLRHRPTTASPSTDTPWPPRGSPTRLSSWFPWRAIPPGTGSTKRPGHRFRFRRNPHHRFRRRRRRRRRCPLPRNTWRCFSCCSFHPVSCPQRPVPGFATGARSYRPTRPTVSLEMPLCTVRLSTTKTALPVPSPVALRPWCCRTCEWIS